MKILLGVTGSIAAYKSARLVRLLVKEGWQVKVVMTHDAQAFITPLTLATLSKNPVLSSLYNPKDGTWVNHVELAGWADIFLIAPCSANTLAKMASGLCDNLLLTTYLSFTKTILVVPAMDRDMFQHLATKNNIETLTKRGVTIIPPNDGELASGLHGVGRMAEPEEILALLKKKA